MRILNGRPTSACFKAPKLATIFCQREREWVVVVGRVPGVTALPSGEAGRRSGRRRVGGEWHCSEACWTKTAAAIPQNCRPDGTLCTIPKQHSMATSTVP